MMEWKTIDSAPKDGTKVILFCSYTVKRNKGECDKILNKSYMCMGFWQELPDLSNKKFDCMNQNKKRLLSMHNGYWSAHFKGEKPLSQLPTHWMPLPAPPQEQEE